MALNYITKQQAEKVSGMKLDGRKKYFINDGEVCISEKFTGGCSGCLSDDDYSDSTIGGGCFECGYTGKRVQSYSIPVKYAFANV